MSLLTPKQLKQRRDYEAEVRKRQPMLDKIIKRASCLLGECGKLTAEERIIAGRKLHEIADSLSKPSGSRPT